METLKIWAEHGGLIGMVVFSLFTIIIMFHHSLTRKDQRHERFLERMMGNEREERRNVHKEHSGTYNRLSDALGGLTDELKKSRKD